MPPSDPRQHPFLVKTEITESGSGILKIVITSESRQQKGKCKMVPLLAPQMPLLFAVGGGGHIFVR